MKAFLLAAGQGTRLQPLTNTIPKCLVPIGGKPLLTIWLELCQRNGIFEVLINLNWKAEEVKEFLEDPPVDIRIRLFEEPQLLGTAGTLAANRSWIEEDKLFWIFYADVLTNADLNNMLAFHRERDASFTMGLVTTNEPSRCGIAQLDEREVAR